jgi:hypothetical protein
VAAAEQRHHGARIVVDAAVAQVRVRLAEQSPEVVVYADLVAHLRAEGRDTAAMVGAAAIVQLAKSRPPGRRMACEPGS